ncbi:MAG: hypothetical protein QNJ89_01330 [Acidimicrobiia bacterium]|nr:hypothetical protein [Acidimicrobiia bacterium]
MKTATTYLLLVVAMASIITSCGGSDDASGDGAEANTTTTAPASAVGGDAEPTTSAADMATTTTSEATQAPSSIGEAGSFRVNDTEFAVTTLNRCIPFSDQAGNIDLQALARGEQGSAKLNLNLDGEFLDVSVDGSGISAEFGSIAFGKDPDVESSEVSGDRWTGSATVGDSLDSGDRVDLAWDVMIPEEINDCSL